MIVRLIASVGLIVCACGDGGMTLLVCDLPPGPVDVQLEIRHFDESGVACIGRDETTIVDGTLTVGDPTTLEYELDGVGYTINSDEIVTTLPEPEPALRCDPESGWLGRGAETCADVVFAVVAR